MKNIALIGLGHQAVSDHIPGLEASNRARLVAVADPDPTRLATAAVPEDVRRYADVADLIRREQIDLAIIATPHSTHEAIVRVVAQAGIHILKEKPLAPTVAEAIRIQNIAREHDVTILTAVQRRLDPIYEVFRSWVELVEKPYLLESKYTIYTEHPDAGWRGSRKTAGGGALIDMGYHMVDLIIWFLGLPSSVSALTSHAAVERSYDAEDTAVLQLQWPSGLNGTCVISRSYAPKNETLTLVGQNGYIQLGKNLISRHQSNGAVIEQIERTELNQKSSVRLIDHALHIAETRGVSPLSPEAQLQHVKLINSAYRSAESRSVVNVDHTTPIIDFVA